METTYHVPTPAALRASTPAPLRDLPHNLRAQAEYARYHSRLRSVRNARAHGLLLEELALLDALAYTYARRTGCAETFEAELPDFSDCPF